MKKNYYQDAISDCMKLLKIDEKNVGGYYILGCAYERLGQIDRGIENFSIVLQLDPNHVNAIFARAACMNKKGDFTNAIEDYNKAL